MLAFSIGLLSTLHCFGMCGGIVGALTMSLDPKIRTDKRQLFKYSMAYNIGRILSYVTAGVILGLLGQAFLQAVAPEGTAKFLRIVTAILVIILGIYIARWIPQVSLIEKLGLPIWKRLEPIGKRIMPIKKPSQAFMFGMVWGWLPCGLVYYALMLALTTESAIDSGIFMALFGAGTLAPMVGASMFAGKLTHFHRAPWLRNVTGGILVLVGIISLFLIFGHHQDHSLHLHH